jgi:protein arginine N-methyltransferase 6
LFFFFNFFFQLMVKDEPRTKAYLAAILSLREQIAGKVVLDVGAGTGILSMFCAKYGGAARVYAVEASDMAEQAIACVRANRLEGVVTVVHDRMEEVQLPEQVDVIISEWMGFALLHESMFASVCLARDRWLRPGGLMLPSAATIYVAPVSLQKFRQEKIDFWSSVYGLDLSPIGERAMAEAASGPVVEIVSPAELCAAPGVLARLNLCNVSEAELQTIAGQFSFSVPVDGFFSGMCCWFDVEFPAPLPAAAVMEARTEGAQGEVGSDMGAQAQAQAAQAAQAVAQAHAAAAEHSGAAALAASESEPAARVVLGTSPQDPPTHWKQTNIFIGRVFPVAAGQVIDCLVRMRQNADNSRLYEFDLEFC